MLIGEGELTQKELVKLIFSLSQVVTASTQVMIMRTAKSGEAVDSELMDEFARASQAHIDAITFVKAKLGMD